MSVVRTAGLVIATILALLQPAMSAYAEDIPTEPAYLYRAIVVRVVDGDTIDVDIDLGFYVWIKKQRIRLLGIDAPEVKGATRPEGLAATEHLKSLIEGESIILRTVKGDDGGDRDDSFGRWLGTIYHGDIDVNAEIYARGTPNLTKIGDLFDIAPIGVRDYRQAPFRIEGQGANAEA